MEIDKTYTIEFKINFARFGEAKEYLQKRSDYKFGIKIIQINKEKNINNSFNSSIVNLNDSLMYFKDCKIKFSNITIDKDSLMICFFLFIENKNDEIIQLKPVALNLKKFVINKEKEELFTMPDKSFSAIKYFVREDIVIHKVNNSNNNNNININNDEEKVNNSQNSTKDSIKGMISSTNNPKKIFSSNFTKNSSEPLGENFRKKGSGVPNNGGIGVGTGTNDVGVRIGASTVIDGGTVGVFEERKEKNMNNNINNNNNMCKSINNNIINYINDNTNNNRNIGNTKLSMSFSGKNLDYNNKLINNLKDKYDENNNKNLDENKNINNNSNNINSNQQQTSSQILNKFNNATVFSPQKANKTKKLMNFISQTPNLFSSHNDKCVSLSGTLNSLLPNRLNKSQQINQKNNYSTEVILYQELPEISPITPFDFNPPSENTNSNLNTNTNPPNMNNYETFCIGVFVSGLKFPLKFSSILNNSEEMTAPCGHLGCSIFPALEPELLHTYVNKNVDLHQELTNLVANMCFPLGIKPCFECVFDNNNKISNLQNPQKTFYNVIKNEKNEIFYIATMQYFLKMTIDEFNNKYTVNPITYYLNKMKKSPKNNEKKFKENMQIINKLLKNNTVFIPESISLLSKYPFYVPMNLCLRCMLSLQTEEMNNLINHLINEVPLPPKYKQILFYIPKMKTPIILNHNLNKYIDTSNLSSSLNINKNINININKLKQEKLTMSQINAKIILEKISIDNILMIFQLILLEQKILFIDKDYEILSEICFIFINLIYPLTWISPFLPVLSIKTVKYLQSPVPYIMGLDEFLLKYADDSNNIYLGDEMIVYNICSGVFISSLTRKHVHKKDILHDYKLSPLPDNVSEFMLKELKKLKKIGDKIIKKNMKLKEKEKEEKNKEKDKNKDKSKDKSNDKSKDKYKSKDTKDSKNKDKDNDYNNNSSNCELLTEEELDKEIRLVFLKAMIMLIGDYNNFTFYTEDETPLFNKEAFIESHKNKDSRNFLSQLVKTQIFEQFLLNETQLNQDEKKKKKEKESNDNINNKNDNSNNKEKDNEEEKNYELIDTSYFRRMVEKNQNLLNAEEVRKKAFVNTKRSSSKSKKGKIVIPRNKNIHPIHGSSSLNVTPNLDNNNKNSNYNNLNHLNNGCLGLDVLSQEVNNKQSHNNIKSSKDIKKRDNNDLNIGILNPVSNINCGKNALIDDKSNNNNYNIAINNNLNNNNNNPSLDIKFISKANASIDFNYGIKKTNTTNYINFGWGNPNASAEINFEPKGGSIFSRKKATPLQYQITRNSCIGSGSNYSIQRRTAIKKFLLYPYFIEKKIFGSNEIKIITKKDVENAVNDYFLKKKIRVQTQEQVHIFIITKKRGYVFDKIVQNKIYLLAPHSNLFNIPKSLLTEKVMLEENNNNMNVNSDCSNISNNSFNNGSKLVNKEKKTVSNFSNNIKNIKKELGNSNINRNNINNNNNNNNNNINSINNNNNKNINNNKEPDKEKIKLQESNISLIKECFRTCCTGKDQIKSSQFDSLEKIFLQEENKRFFAQLLIPDGTIKNQKNHKQLNSSSFEDLQKMVKIALKYLSSNEYDTCRLLTIACCVYYKIEKDKDTKIVYLYKDLTQGIYACRLWSSDEFWIEFYRLEFEEESSFEQKMMEIFEGGGGLLGEGNEDLGGEKTIVLKNKVELAMEVALFVSQIMFDLGLEQNKVLNVFQNKILVNYVNQYSEVNEIIRQIIISLNNI